MQSCIQRTHPSSWDQLVLPQVIFTVTYELQWLKDWRLCAPRRNILWTGRTHVLPGNIFKCGIGKLDVTVVFSASLCSSFTKNVHSALNGFLQYILFFFFSCNIFLTEQLEGSFQTSNGARHSSLAPHLTQTRDFSLASKLSNVISYYCWVYLANRLPSFSLDISGTGVKNLRNFAFAVPPIGYHPLPLSYLHGSFLNPAQTCNHPYILQHTLLFLALHLLSTHLICHVVFVDILFLVYFHPTEHECHKSRFFLSLSFSAIIQCLGQCLACRRRCSVNDYWVNTCRNCLHCVATD